MTIEDDVRVVDDCIDDAAEDLTFHEMLVGVELCSSRQFAYHVLDLLSYPLHEVGK